MKKNKKIVVQILVIVISLVLVGLIIYMVLKPKTYGEKYLKNELSNMGEKFYTTFYYEQISKDKNFAQVKSYLSKYKDIGIKVSLTSLSQYNSNSNDETIAKFKNEKGEQCNWDNTKVIIYPKDPYTKTDYTIETILDCNFYNIKE